MTLKTNLKTYFLIVVEDAFLKTITQYSSCAKVNEQGSNIYKFVLFFEGARR